MTQKELTIMVDALSELSFGDTSIKEFATKIRIHANTLYNYTKGKVPSEKYYNRVMEGLNRYHRDIVEQAEEKNR